MEPNKRKEMLQNMETEFLVLLLRENIPADMLELLVYGNPDRKIKPKVLSRILKTVMEKYED